MITITVLVESSSFSASNVHNQHCFGNCLASLVDETAAHASTVSRCLSAWRPRIRAPVSSVCTVHCLRSSPRTGTRVAINDVPACDTCWVFAV